MNKMSKYSYVSSEKDFQILRLAAATKNTLTILFKKSPWLMAESDNPGLADAKDKGLLCAINPIFSFRRKTALDVETGLDGLTTFGTLGSDFHLYYDETATTLSIKNWLKLLAERVEAAGFKGDEPFWSFSLQASHMAYTSIFTNQWTMRNVIDYMQSSINVNFNDVYRNALNRVIYYKLEYEYFNSHPIALNDIRDLHKRLGREESSPADPFLVETRKTLLSTVTDFKKKLHDVVLENENPKGRTNWLLPASSSLPGMYATIHARDFTQAFSKALAAVLTMRLEDETLKLGLIERHVREHSLNEVFSEDLIKKIFAMPELKAAVTAMEMLRDDPGLPDFRYYLAWTFSFGV